MTRIKTIVALAMLALAIMAAPASASGTGWYTYLSHVAPQVHTLSSLSTRIGNANGIDGMRHAANVMNTWAHTEQRWLDNHPPQACYATAHRRWHHVVDLAATATSLFTRGIRTMNADLIHRAATLVSQMLPALRSATAAVNATHC